MGGRGHGPAARRSGSACQPQAVRLRPAVGLLRRGLRRRRVRAAAERSRVLPEAPGAVSPCPESSLSWRKQKFGPTLAQGLSVPDEQVYRPPRVHDMTRVTGVTPVSGDARAAVPARHGTATPARTTGTSGGPTCTDRTEPESGSWPGPASVNRSRCSPAASSPPRP
ncbi:protein of unknown function [Streptomyces sp. KY75]|nr:protein of unknown function [Streptomyces sp. KY70]CAD5990603.1 protein of unknown function [Streptomyces sp. KY75]